MGSALPHCLQEKMNLMSSRPSGILEPHFIYSLSSACSENLEKKNPAAIESTASEPEEDAYKSQGTREG